MPIILRNFSRSPLVLAMGLSALLLSACAQNPSQNDPQAGRGNTQSDALKTAQGRDTARASSQLQFGLNEKQAPASLAAPAAEPAQATIPELNEAKTFLGTLPCLGGGACQVQKLTVTLAPNGLWRLRAQAIGSQGQDQSAASFISLGCWESTAASPRRIILLNQQDSVVADLGFTSKNTIQVHSYNQQQPTLSTSLTRQADVDPISELDNTPVPACR